MHSFQDLLAFVTVVDSGSFTAAAERLGMAKSAVSRRVARLETRLGVQLIRRTTRRLFVTDSGRSFHQRAERIIADLEEAESAVMQAHGELRGRIRLALPLSFGLHHMSEPVAAFSRAHPLVEFELELNDRRVDLLEEGVDLAVRIGRLADSSLIARRLFDTRTVLCASREYLRQHGEPLTPEALRDHSCLLYSNLPDPTRWVCRDGRGRSHQVTVRAAMQVNNGDFLCEAAVAGLGIVLQPAFIAHERIKSGELVPLLSNYQWPVSPAWAVYPPTRHLSYRVRAFIDFLAERFSGEPYWDAECRPQGPASA